MTYFSQLFWEKYVCFLTSPNFFGRSTFFLHTSPNFFGRSMFFFLLLPNFLGDVREMLGDVTLSTLKLGGYTKKLGEVWTIVSSLQKAFHHNTPVKKRSSICEVNFTSFFLEFFNNLRPVYALYERFVFIMGAPLLASSPPP